MSYAVQSYALHSRVIDDLNNLNKLDNLWIKSNKPMYKDSSCQSLLDNPMSLELINIADIRVLVPVTITVTDIEGNEIYVATPILIEDFNTAQDGDQTVIWDDVQNKPAFTNWAFKPYSNGTTSDILEGTRLYYTDARVKTYADTLYLPIAGIDASKVISGVFDLARIPALPSSNTIVCTTIPAMTSGDQLLVGKGTVVIESTTGNTYRYSGTGSVILNASYIQQSDMSPDWATITNRPINISTWTNDSGYISTLAGDARYSQLGHKHLWADITDKPSTFTPTAHIHAATDITQTASYRFATDTEKSTWNAKQNAITTGTTAQYLRGDLSLATFPTTWAWGALTGIPFYFGDYTAFQGFWPSGVTKNDGNFSVLWAKDNSEVYLNAKTNIVFQTNTGAGTGADRTTRLLITPTLATFYTPVTAPNITASTLLTAPLASITNFTTRPNFNGITPWDGDNLSFGTGNTNMARGDHNHSGVYQPALGYTPINKAGDTGIGDLQLTDGNRLLLRKDTIPNALAYANASLQIESVDDAIPGTYCAGIGLHNRGVNAGYLYLNRVVDGHIRLRTADNKDWELWDSGNLAQVDGSGTNGWLSSVDWNKFNNKVDYSVRCNWDTNPVNAAVMYLKLATLSCSSYSHFAGTLNITESYMQGGYASVYVFAQGEAGALSQYWLAMTAGVNGIVPTDIILSKTSTTTLEIWLTKRVGVSQPVYGWDIVNIKNNGFTLTLPSIQPTWTTVAPTITSYSTSQFSTTHLPLVGGTLTGNLLGSTSYNIGSSSNWWGNVYTNQLYIQNQLITWTGSALSVPALIGTTATFGLASMATWYGDSYAWFGAKDCNNATGGGILHLNAGTNKGEMYVRSAPTKNVYIGDNTDNYLIVNSTNATFIRPIVGTGATFTGIVNAGSGSTGGVINAFNSALGTGSSISINVGLDGTRYRSGGILWMKGATDADNYLSLETFTGDNALRIKSRFLNVDPTNGNLTSSGSINGTGLGVAGNGWVTGDFRVSKLLSNDIQTITFTANNQTYTITASTVWVTANSAYTGCVIRMPGITTSNKGSHITINSWAIGGASITVDTNDANCYISKSTYAPLSTNQTIALTANRTWNIVHSLHSALSNGCFYILNYNE